jgi:predicted  nucleic acid-binding Zn-ribbon protein
LQYLFALQQIDSHLDELEEQTGDLPREVRGLEAKSAELEAQIRALEEEMRSAFAGRDEADSDIVNLRAKVEKYKSQQLLVKSNREYDALTRETDMATETIAKKEQEMEQLEGKGTLARTDLETVRAQAVEVTALLEEKRVALAEVSKTTEDEELEYGEKRKKLLARISAADLAAYERIRRAKRGGEAVVRVKRSACGGCYGRVPPQILLELRQNNRLYTCEHCGRIIVSDEVAEASAQIV